MNLTKCFDMIKYLLKSKYLPSEQNQEAAVRLLDKTITNKLIRIVRLRTNILNSV